MKIETKSRMEQGRNGETLLIHYTTNNGRMMLVSFDIFIPAGMGC